MKRYCWVPRYAARNQPVILLPGVNHSHLSNGEVREGSGDLSAEVSLAEANEAVGGTVADFLTTSFCPIRFCYGVERPSLRCAPSCARVSYRAEPHVLMIHGSGAQGVAACLSDKHNSMQARADSCSRAAKAGMRHNGRLAGTLYEGARCTSPYPVQALKAALIFAECFHCVSHSDEVSLQRCCM